MYIEETQEGKVRFEKGECVLTKASWKIMQKNEARSDGMMES